MGDREKLHEIIRRRSLRVGGSFKLASGRMSSVYLNLKPTMLDPDGARLIGAALAGQAAALGADYVGGLEMGAVPLVAAAAAMSAVAGKPVKAVFVRKQAKDHGTQSLVEGLAEGESSSGPEGGRGRGRDDDRRLVLESGRHASRRRRHGRACGHRRRPRGGRDGSLRGGGNFAARALQEERVHVGSLTIPWSPDSAARRM